MHELFSNEVDMIFKWSKPEINKVREWSIISTTSQCALGWNSVVYSQDITSEHNQDFTSPPTKVRLHITLTHQPNGFLIKGYLLDVRAPCCIFSLQWTWEFEFVLESWLQKKPKNQKQTSSCKLTKYYIHEYCCLISLNRKPPTLFMHFIGIKPGFERIDP